MRSPIRKIAFSAVIAAAYAALAMLLAPISYGPVQFRISEVLCILPFFFPESVWGLFVGCLIANLLSSFGPIDVIFGSLATLMAALCTMKIGKTSRSVPSMVLGCLSPVLWNGVIIGIIISTLSGSSDGFLAGFLLFGGQVALGEAAVLFVIGLPMTIYCEKKGVFRKIAERFLRSNG